MPRCRACGYVAEPGPNGSIYCNRKGCGILDVPPQRVDRATGERLEAEKKVKPGEA